MALIKCPECKKKISNTVKACPHCGYVLSESEKEVPAKKQKIKNLKQREKIELKKVFKNKKILIPLIVICVLIVGFITYKLITKNDINKLSKSVVILYGYDEIGEKTCSGSGFVYDDDSTIVTNFHVIDSCDKVVAQDENGKKYPIEGVVGYDKDKDIAILKTKKETDLSVLDVNTDKLKKGDEVTAIGSPKGLVNSVTKGIVSSIRKKGNGSEIQISAPVSEGSSGGALFDKDGYVVGITYSSLNDSQNINFAIPIEEVSKVKINDVEKLSEVKRRYGENNGYDNYIALMSNVARTGEFYWPASAWINADGYASEWANKEMDVSGYVANIHYYKDYNTTDVLIVPKKNLVKCLNDYNTNAITYETKLYKGLLADGSRYYGWEENDYGDRAGDKSHLKGMKLIYNLKGKQYKAFLDLIEQCDIDKYGKILPLYLRYSGDITDSIHCGEYITQKGKFDTKTEYHDLLDSIVNNKKDYDNPKESFAFATHYYAFKTVDDK